ncbi:hypothetical protein TNCV_2109091 [Trichonephila clavipes]|nr:hypothetical protein TNCV_2109091 [Trichonephila clavipes]
MDSNDVQEQRSFHNQALIFEEFIEIHAQQKDIEEVEPLDPVQSKDRMKIGYLTEGLNLIERVTSFRL